MATTRSRLIEENTGGEGETSAIGDVGPTALGVSLGIQVLLAGLLFVPTPGRPALTTIGDIGFKPEWDGLLFVVGGAVGVVLAAVFCLVRGRWRRLPRVGAPAQVAIAVAGVAISLACFRYGRRFLIAGDPVSRAYLLVLLGLMAATAVVGLLGRPSPVVRASSEKAQLPSEKAQLPSEKGQPRRRARSWPLDGLIAIAIVAVFYQPGSRLLAGQTLQLDSMLHWDYFAMGPTLAYHAGTALGTDVHVFYGVGWPVLFSALSSVVPISYAHMIVAAQFAGCAYLIGAYAFLRLFLRDRLWGVTGVVLVLVFGVFARSAAPFAPYWGFPSLSLVRGAFDVWFFAALVLSLRSSRLRSSGRRWDVVAGILVGLAILFELDTGFYLAAALGFFWLCRGAASTDRHEVARRAATATAAGAVVLLAGLAVASRWTLVHPEFWPGWLENLRATSSGFSMEPLATGTPPWTIVVLVLMMAVYLAVVSHALVRAIRGRISTDALVLGTLAGYGFLITLYFLGRSTPYNLVRCTAPFALLLAALGSRAGALGPARLRARSRHGGGDGFSSPWFSRAPAVVALGLSLVLLVQNPVFRAHRGLARVALGGRHPEGVCKFDFCGLGPDWSTNLDRVRVVADRLHQLAPNGEKVAVLDQTGPLFHLLSGTAPWGRYTPLLISLYNPERLESVIDHLESDPPAVAVIRTADSPIFDDTLTPLRAVVRDHFDMDSELEGYQIWRLRAGAPTG